MDMDELLGIDDNDPEERLSAALVRNHQDLLDDLVAYRKSCGLKQEDLAKRLGVGQSAIARIESGERDARPSTFRRYALALGVEIRHQAVTMDGRVISRPQEGGWRQVPASGEGRGRVPSNSAQRLRSISWNHDAQLSRGDHEH